MKNCLIYGFVMTFAAFLLRLVLFIAGLESDPAHSTAARWIGGFAGLVIAIVVLVLGIKARRREVPPETEFTYGQAFKTGMGIQLFCAIFSPVTTYVYLSVINPHFIDMMIQANRDKMEARGLGSDQIDRAEHMMRLFTTPGAQAIESFFGVLIFGAIVTLIVAAFLRRTGAHDPLPA
jgi:Protein of unknown function (DUF4199)